MIRDSVGIPRQAGFEIAVRNITFATRPEHQHATNGATETVKQVEWLLVARKPLNRYSLIANPESLIPNPSS